ncbi:MAG: hypothetical protein MJE77_22940 [Proteobacteria bacterium]|nr:hypothetical protein [Pseudomonadota bacterium]
MPIRIEDHHKSGSSWLLQTMKADELVGSVSAWINKDGRGVVRFGTFKDSQWLQVIRTDGFISVRIHEGIGLHLAGLLLRVVAQNRELRRRASVDEPALFAHVETAATSTLEFHDGDKEWLGVAHLTRSDEIADLDDAEDQWDIRMTEDCAETLALSVFDRLGQISASRF